MPGKLISLAALFVTAMIPVLPVRAQPGEAALIPIATTATDFPGGGGSLWRTEFTGYNSSDENVFIRYLDMSCLRISPCTQGLGLGPGQVSTRFSWAQGFAAGFDYPHGVLFYYDRKDADVLHFHLRVRDLSRHIDSAGTEIPVVRESEFRTETIHLLNIPSDPLFRTHLRIYGPDSVGGRVSVRFFDQETDVLLAEQEIELEIPSFTFFFPDYGEIAGLREHHPAIGNARLIRVAVEPLLQDLRFWAFISITNNETQQVTLITPQ